MHWQFAGNMSDGSVRDSLTWTKHSYVCEHTPLPYILYTKVQILSACLPVSSCCSFMEFQCGCLNSYVKLKTSNMKYDHTPADAELMLDAVREGQR